MANKRPNPEDIVSKLRQVEVLMGQGRPDEDRLVADMIEPAHLYGRYGCRRIAALLNPGYRCTWLQGLGHKKGEGEAPLTV